MNQRKEIIKRIKKGESHSIFFPDNGDVYRIGMSEVNQIDYHIADLRDIAQNGKARLGLISIVLLRLVENLEAMQDSYGAVEEAEQIINPEV